MILFKKKNLTDPKLLYGSVYNLEVQHYIWHILLYFFFFIYKFTL